MATTVYTTDDTRRDFFRFKSRFAANHHPNNNNNNNNPLSQARHTNKSFEWGAILNEKRNNHAHPICDERVIISSKESQSPSD